MIDLGGIERKQGAAVYTTSELDSRYERKGRARKSSSFNSQIQSG